MWQKRFPNDRMGGFYAHGSGALCENRAGDRRTEMVIGAAKRNEMGSIALGG